LRAVDRRLGQVDLRIAPIVSEDNVTWVTGNTNDFKQVPGLRIEDCS
jgi:predicted nucleic acid-binding protein